jgi:hypothetical protein
LKEKIPGVGLVPATCPFAFDRVDDDATVRTAKTQVGDGVVLCCNRHCGEGREQCGYRNPQIPDFHGKPPVHVVARERDMRYRSEL